MKNPLKNCKTKRILIDAFNLMYKMSETDEHMHRGELITAMNKTVEIMADYARSAKKEITVVFDGKKTEGNPVTHEKKKGIRIEYSHDLSADFIIMQKIRKERQPQMVTVITSDREIQFFLNRFHTPYIKSEDFVEILKNELAEPEIQLPEKDENVKLNDEEISFWERMFRSRS